MQVETKIVNMKSARKTKETHWHRSFKCQHIHEREYDR